MEGRFEVSWSGGGRVFRSSTPTTRLVRLISVAPSLPSASMTILGIPAPLWSRRTRCTASPSLFLRPATSSHQLSVVVGRIGHKTLRVSYSNLTDFAPSQTHQNFVPQIIRPCAAVCAISALKVKNGFLAYFALAAAKAKRRYPAMGPFQDSDVGKSGEYSDVAILQLKSNSLRILPPPRWHPRRIMRTMTNSSAPHVASSLHLRPSYLLTSRYPSSSMIA